MPQPVSVTTISAAFSIGGERNGDAAALGRKADGVIDEVADRAAKQNRIREDLAFALTVDLEVSLGRDRFIVSRNFLDRGPAIKSRSMDLALRRFRPGEKEQVVDDPGKSGALRHARFNHSFIFVRRTRTGQRHLGFAANIGQRECAVHGRDRPRIGRDG